ncbi:MAG TPA: ATP-binding protein [Cyclobacteriaceae bacterium]|nr:hypothetical protein [Cyclobacteriaceae bacterium]HMX88025.1 ATP-binding protein [Saprospiraceae bacterium]HMX00857.1 ATP-binding protein [Cyclobacteriaceae bacterium]HMY93661.1 ATP-binding protein [Cyclobacteriaceae bacterium]HNA12905.1 ATP-binding protein [Cyclobacteriaceae bacterium]
MNQNELKLRERVKELNCLYKLSRIAWEANNDVDAIIQKTLDILPDAMQLPDLAEACISIGTRNYSTKGFKKATVLITGDLALHKKKFGAVKVGYRRSSSGKGFLAEERNLVKTVAQELSLLVHRVSIEDDKRKLQIQLQHAERLAFVGELSAGIAHELNEPLGRVLGFAQLIKKAGSLNEQQAEDLERIIKASLYSREIIKKLMIFSRQMPQQVARVNLNTVVENILYFIDVRFQGRNIRITKSLDPSLPVILADEVQMSQVLVNLITNAVFAMPRGGIIKIVTKVKGQSVALIVKDTGSGMTPEIRKKIFEPFFTTKPVGQGTGLGLSVVHGIVDSHKGQILVNTTPGKGTSFEIRLPRQLKRK